MPIEQSPADAPDWGKQRDFVYRIRYDRQGGHVHCRLFSRPREQATWAKCGNFVVGKEEWFAFLKVFNNCDVLPEETP